MSPSHNARVALPSDRLRVSPTFVLAFSMDGRPYVAKDSEPYTQYWLSERDRVLHSICATRGGCTAEDAVDKYYRVARVSRSVRESNRLRRALADMWTTGILASAGGETSRYAAEHVRDYVAHRPFPQEIAAAIATMTGLTAATRVLDLAGGPGDLALALARTSRHVSLMDLSRGFLAAAKRRAKARDLRLATLHESCNRLPYCDEQFDLVTVSQALHWLDDVLVVRGVCRVLRQHGSFVVVHSSIDVPDSHVFADVLGRDSIFGKKIVSFDDEVRALRRRLTLLFDTMNVPEARRVDVMAASDARRGTDIVPVGLHTFDQARPFDLGFMRGLLTDAHITAIGLDPKDFWATHARRASAVDPSRMMGTLRWALLHFQRGGARACEPHGLASTVINFCPGEVS